MKTCPKCKIKKSITKFSKCSARKDGLAYECKPCRCRRDYEYYQKNKASLITKAKQYWAINRDRKRNNDLKLKYGITLENYNKILEQQDYKCAICKKTPVEIHPRSKKQLPLSVDHCHENGRVRGLLCRSCNQKLGIYELHKEKFKKYLERFN